MNSKVGAKGERFVTFQIEQKYREKNDVLHLQWKAESKKYREERVILTLK